MSSRSSSATGEVQAIRGSKVGKERHMRDAYTHISTDRSMLGLVTKPVSNSASTQILGRYCGESRWTLRSST